MDAIGEQALINDFVENSFRDCADKDYIAARVCHRHGLYAQFLWLSLQCLEKYLKAILIYNKKSAKQIAKSGHSVLDAYRKVLEIPDIDFDFPNDVLKFIEYLDNQGPNRYFEYDYVTYGDELFRLDRTVWHVRRYCFYLRTMIKNSTGEILNQFPYNIEKIQGSYTLKHPNKYRIGGFLEEVLAKQSSLREQLVWKNFYYGTYKKKIIKNYKVTKVYGKPTHFLYPEIFPVLNKLVQFSSEVKEYFNDLNKS
jgi:HEPN domain-containing protein